MMGQEIGKTGDADSGGVFGTAVRQFGERHAVAQADEAARTRRILGWVMAMGYLLLTEAGPEPKLGADAWRARRELMETFAADVKAGSAGAFPEYLDVAAKDCESRGRFWGAGLCGQVLAFCAQADTMAEFCRSDSFLRSAELERDALGALDELTERQRGNILITFYLALTFSDRENELTAKKRAAALVFLQITEGWRNAESVATLQQANKDAVSWKFATEGRLGGVVKVLEALYPKD